MVVIKQGTSDLVIYRMSRCSVCNHKVESVTNSRNHKKIFDKGHNLKECSKLRKERDRLKAMSLHPAGKGL